MLSNNKFGITYDEVKKIHAKFLYNLYNDKIDNEDLGGYDLLCKF